MCATRRRKPGEDAMAAALAIARQDGAAVGELEAQVDRFVAD
jgi:hypothetical protein